MGSRACCPAAACFGGGERPGGGRDARRPQTAHLVRLLHPTHSGFAVRLEAEAGDPWLAYSPVLVGQTAALPPAVVFAGVWAIIPGLPLRVTRVVKSGQDEFLLPFFLHEWNLKNSLSSMLVSNPHRCRHSALLPHWGGGVLSGAGDGKQR